jgi:hypothetical protein
MQLYAQAGLLRAYTPSEGEAEATKKKREALMAVKHETNYHPKSARFVFDEMWVLLDLIACPDPRAFTNELKASVAKMIWKVGAMNENDNSRRSKHMEQVMKTCTKYAEIKDWFKPILAEAKADRYAFAREHIAYSGKSELFMDPHTSLDDIRRESA